MTKKLGKYKIIELLCVAALVAFIIVLLVSLSSGTQKSIKEISAPALKVLDISKMSKKSKNETAKTFEIDTDKAEGIVYYSNDNIMDVSEILIVKLKNPSDAKEFESAVEKRVTNQENLFKNYAPEQYALLQESIIETDGNVLFYCTAVNNKEVYNTFKKGL